jgi:diguanylate cyclase (GGDEF)-like protein
MSFNPKQRLNDWVTMLDAIYGDSQNYAKSPYEIHAHLTEVCGIFAKHLLRRRDIGEAEKFLPKIFSWTVALLLKVHPGRGDIEGIILRKFPNACPYCLEKPCKCWKGEKPTLHERQLRDAYYQRTSSTRRSANDFQLMFRDIYADSWNAGGDERPSPELLRNLIIRLLEEVAEVGEAVRFHHLYPENFENELADLVAWWFALTSSMPTADGQPMLLAEECLWRAYPAHCPDCLMIPCLCRPGPVRRLMSRPIPGDGHRFDSLTSLLNQAAYNEDISLVEKREMALPSPSVCVRLDVDNFKDVNTNYGHSAGDEALRHIAAVVRRTVRERDRVYRISGDEFGVLCADYSEEEAAGAMRRVCVSLASHPVRWVDKDGQVSEFRVSLSIGVAEVTQPARIAAAFDLADKATYASKAAGKGRVSRASELGI